MGYSMVMYTLIRSQTFIDWLKSLRDEKVKTRITFRLQQAIQGNFGDSKPVGEGISEMRIDVGAGYRVYYVRTDKTVIFLLMGGNKSTPDNDIKRAKKMAQELKKEKP
jgi:putative addiction module killer protein